MELTPEQRQLLQTFAAAIYADTGLVLGDDLPTASRIRITANGSTYTAQSFPTLTPGAVIREAVNHYQLTVPGATIKVEPMK